MERYIYFIIIFILSGAGTASADSTWDGSSKSSSLSGTGYITNPYLIQSAADFAYMCSMPESDTKNRYFYQTDNLIFPDQIPQSSVFAGNYDGNCYKIQTGYGVTFKPLFLSLSGTIRKVVFIQNHTYNSSESWGAGTLIGTVQTTGTVQDCYVNITGRSNQNGFHPHLVYQNYGTIRHCYDVSSGYSNGNTTNDNVMVETNSGTISHCHSHSKVSFVKTTTAGSVTDCDNNYVELADFDGTNVSWSYDSSYKNLRISGKGHMKDYYGNGNVTNAPWSSYYSDIKEVNISGDILSVGDRSFMGCYKIASVCIPNNSKIHQNCINEA